MKQLLKVIREILWAFTLAVIIIFCFFLFGALLLIAGFANSQAVIVSIIITSLIGTTFIFLTIDNI